jgi:hypothetical protein
VSHDFGPMRTDLIVQPEKVEGNFLYGRIWSTRWGRLVEVRAELPPRLAPEEAMRAAAEGRLVLGGGSGRMCWARG